MARAELVGQTVASAGGAMLAGSVIGLPIGALVAGFGGGLVGLGLMPPIKSLAARASSVAMATLTGGFMGPYTSALLHVDSIPQAFELHAFSFLWGAGAQILLPAAIDALRRRIRQAGGNVDEQGGPK